MAGGLATDCNGIIYKVKKGDTLPLISQNLGISVDEIIKNNPELFINSDNPEPGQEICLKKRESIAYLYGGTTDFYLGLISKTKNSIDTVCTDSFEVSDDGNLLIAAQNKLNSEFINSVHARNIKITPFLTNNWSRNLGVLALENRENLSSQIANTFFQYDLDGINIDIENVNEDYRAIYVDFIKLLRKKIPENKIISVAVVANPNGWTNGWHGSYDYKMLSEYSDYLIIMAYDESYQGSEEGPVSGSGFFENSIKYALNQGVEKEKIVVAIPFFGRYWKVGEPFGGIGIADVDVENLLKNYESTSKYYELTKSAFAQVTIKPNDPKPSIWGYRTLSAGTYNIWYDNIEATKFKLKLIDSYGLKGVGCWALGQENPEIWSFYTYVLNEKLFKGIGEYMTKEEILNLVYPIGSIYMSVNGMDPSDLFGGSWVRFANGRTVFSVDESDVGGNFGFSEKTGGTLEHRHNFRIAMHWWYGAACGENTGNGTGAYRYSDNQYDGWARNLESKSMIVNNSDYNTRSASVASPDGKWSLGDTDTSENLPPYITCYIWKRVL